jgi:hypothetical protein
MVTEVVVWMTAGFGGRLTVLGCAAADDCATTIATSAAAVRKEALGVMARLS